MSPIARIATLALLSLAVLGPASWQILSAAAPSPVTTASQVDRSLKGDRVAGTTPANVTIVGKSTTPSAAPLRERSDAGSRPVKPVKTLREGDKNKRLDGCDPLVSPLASSTLSQVPGRCIADAGGDTKIAMLAR